MGLGKTGASNAALLAVEILSLRNPRLKKKLKEYRLKLAAQVEEASKKVRRKT
jgi:5-(carboxyamino)imidazole ribonucleotide mutase